MAQSKARINGNELDAAWIKEECYKQNEKLSQHIEDSPTQHYLLVLGDYLKRGLKAKLEALGVQILQHNGDNIYLCFCKDKERLQDIYDQESVHGVIPCPSELKIESSLQLSGDEGIDTRQVQIFLRSEIDMPAEKVSEEISTVTSIPTQSMSIEDNQSVIRMEIKQIDLMQIASFESVAAIREVVDLDYNIYTARETIGVNKLPNNTQYEGDDQTITVADFGFDKGSLQDVHPAFGTRVSKLVAVNREGQTNDRNGHGTHVCGTILGNGQCREGNIRGTAPNSKLVVQSIDDEQGQIIANMNTFLQQSYFTHASRVHNNSWSPRWRSAVTNSDGKKGIQPGQKPYNSQSKDIDQFIYEHPDMCVCFAAGNFGMEPLQSGNTSWPGHIGGVAASKNVNTVGSCQNRTSSYNELGTQYSPRGNVRWTLSSISPFSSHGPTLEYRSKPDVVAPGGMVLYAASRDPKALGKEGYTDYGPAELPLWRYLSGTSMATGQVAGCVAVLRQILITACKKANPTAALIKAMLINGATLLEGNVPRSQQGFGRVSLADSIIIPGRDTSTNREFVEGEVYDEDDSDVYTVVIPLSKYLPSEDASKLTLKATMVYSDRGGEALQHILNLCVTIGVDDRFGNSTEHDYLLRDDINNTEQVIWSGLKKETRATIRVILQNALLGNGPKPLKQSFALVWSVIGETG